MEDKYCIEWCNICNIYLLNQQYQQILDVKLHGSDIKAYITTLITHIFQLSTYSRLGYALGLKKKNVQQVWLDQVSKYWLLTDCCSACFSVVLILWFFSLAHLSRRLILIKISQLSSFLALFPLFLLSLLFTWFMFLSSSL